jgi:hypothetical protein
MWEGITPNLKLVLPQIRFDPLRFSVAIHLRRGDLGEW